LTELALANTKYLFFTSTCTDPDGSSIVPNIILQSDGVPLLQIHFQVKVDNGFTYYMYQCHISVLDDGKYPVMYA